MDDSLYDEFGNYIGGDISDEDEDSEEEQGRMGFGGDGGSTAFDGSSTAITTAPVAMSVEKRAVVLHEDKQYYPEAEEIYGPDAVVLVQEEDTMPITEPIIPPTRIFDFDLVEKQIPDTTFKFDYMAGLMQEPGLIRNIAVIGHLQSGKTSLIDCLVRETHQFKSVKLKGDQQYKREMRYLDSRRDEHERGCSVKASAISLVLPDCDEKSYLMNIMDTPGHPNFNDEVAAAVRISDGVIFVVDVIMGLSTHCERLLKHVVQEGLDIVLCVSKVDRLVTELKLPPADAYHKIKHTISEVNTALENIHTLLAIDRPLKVLSPTRGNVIFGAGLFNMVFSLKSFAAIYADTFPGQRSAPPNENSQEDSQQDAAEEAGADGEGEAPTAFGRRGREIQGGFERKDFAPLLWGDIYFNEVTRKFAREPPEDVEDPPRTFVAFILDPLYKMIGHTLGMETEDLVQVLAQLGVYLPKKDYKLSTKDLLKSVGRHFFQGNSALVDAVVKHVRDPKVAAADKVRRTYTGEQMGLIADGMANLDPNGLLMIHVVKSYHHPDLSTFDVFGRVMSGTIHAGERVQVLGENYSLSDDEDKSARTASTLWISQGRYRCEISHVPAGNWVLIGGVDANVVKTATITNLPDALTDKLTKAAEAKGAGESAAATREEVEIFRPLKHLTVPCCKLALEPLNPSELPKMVDGLRKIDKAYSVCKTKVEESGEHVIAGTGELYLDCVLHDLRRLYGDLEIKVSDPIVTFQETVSETSTMKCSAESMNKHNKLFMVCDTLEPAIEADIERGRILEHWEVGSKAMRDHFKKEYDWDILAAKGIWAFGPTDRGVNMLLNDTIDVSKNLLETSKESIVQGFQWASREGPLCDEPIRGVKFKLLDARLHESPQFRGGGQLIPCARRCAYAAFLMAAPRVLEPIYFAEITCPANAVQAVYTVLSRRRGHVHKDYPKPGSPLYIVEAALPVIESFGFETDIRSHTHGAAMVLTCFDHWSQVPGDPLDRSILLRPLEPAPIPHLAREFMLKTRRRKGLAEDVNISKFLDADNYVQFAREEAVLNKDGGDAGFEF
ncbi:unnamed protein product [Amoebophrya sp. A25]|nr:unnamed protein product [Amoebophrya sp. A25]|eukprot:GSA25T00020040001.1